MEVGLCVDPRLQRPWPEALDLAVRHGIRHIEPAGGGHVPTEHLDPIALSQDPDALAAWRESVTSRGLRIAALGVYGNPLHPNTATAEAAHADFTAMCAVAEQLGVERVTVISGGPGGGPLDRLPNWINPAMFFDLENAYDWQWEERLIPYWRKACDVAATHGVTICMEPIGGSMVYNGQTFLRLAEACEGPLKVSIDPSHLWWQGIDPLRAVEQLRGHIGYVQLKDVWFDWDRIARDGLVPACDYADWESRTWIYRAIGFGHDESFWRAFLTALRRAGYDDVVAIELEEPWMTMDEALEHSLGVLAHAVPHDPIPEGNWADGFAWKSASIE